VLCASGPESASLFAVGGTSALSYKANYVHLTNTSTLCSARFESSILTGDATRMRARCAVQLGCYSSRETLSCLFSDAGRDNVFLALILKGFHPSPFFGGGVGDSFDERTGWATRPAVETVD
jgi:hypothetical protein